MDRLVGDNQPVYFYVEVFCVATKGFNRGIIYNSGYFV